MYDVNFKLLNFERKYQPFDVSCTCHFPMRWALLPRHIYGIIVSGVCLCVRVCPIITLFESHN